MFKRFFQWFWHGPGSTDEKQLPLLLTADDINRRWKARKASR